MVISMRTTEELKRQIAEAALRLQSEGAASTQVNEGGLTLVVKGSKAHLERKGKSQYLGDFRNGGEYLLFAN